MSSNDLHDDDQLLHDPQRPHSIDLSLELERQLDSENDDVPPGTDAHNNRPQSLDPHVLASIITQLRLSLADVTKQRDDLAALVTTSHSSEADLKDALQLTTDKCTNLERELEVTRAKIKDDEDAIHMLRTKVEESRRGLMRLQTENRRMSHSNMSLDLSRAGIPSFGGSPSSKRTSFTPLTGSSSVRTHAHRRISSVSDSGFLHLDAGERDIGQYPNSPPPTAQTFTMPLTPHSPIPPPISSGATHPPPSTRRFSGMFGRPSPPESLDIQLQDPVSAELETLRRELNSVKAELEETRHELTESNEAREMSEMCVKVLREFIGENSIGDQSISSDAGSVKLPPLPSSSEKTNGAASGWGFNKLWKTDGSTSSASLPAIQATGPSTVSPFTKKIGGFFGSRASVSSTNSSRAYFPSVQGQEPMYNESDTSSIEESVAEPISPASEVPGTHVMVRDTRGSSTSDLGASPEQQTKTLRGGSLLLTPERTPALCT